MNKRILSMLLVIVMVLSMLPVQVMAEGTGGTGTSGTAGSVTVSSESGRNKLSVGGKLALKVVPPAGYDGATIEWGSSDSTVATVKEGKIIGRSVGENVTLTVRYTAEGQEVRGHITVDVVAPVQITAEPSKSAIAVNDTICLRAETPVGFMGTDKCTWTSSNSSIAEVDDNGKVTGKAAGNAVITASYGDGEMVGTYNVQVNDVESVTISAFGNATKIEKGKSLVLTAEILPETVADKTLSWEAAPTTAVELTPNPEQGQCIVKARTAGDVTIKATCGGVSGAYALQIVEQIIVPATGVKVTGAATELITGEKLELTAEVLPVNATNKEVTWSSSADTVATVDQNGLVETHAKGNAVIYAVCGGKVGAYSITVSDPVAVTKVTVTAEGGANELLEDKTLQLTAAILPENATDKSVTWTSDNEAVATVDENGLVTAVAEGEAKITATSVNNMTGTYSVKVSKPVQAAEVIVTAEGDVDRIQSNATLQLTAQVLPENTSDKTVIWTSDKETVATVDDNGLVKAVSVGTVTITATCGEAVDTYTILVSNEIICEDITITQENRLTELYAGDTLQLTATVSPEDVTDKTVAWSSLDEEVATVSEDGLVHGVSAGEVYIRAQCGAEFNDYFLTVRPARVVAVSEEMPETLLCGETLALDAMVYNRGQMEDGTQVFWRLENAADSDYVILDGSRLTAKAFPEHMHTVRLVASATGAEPDVYEVTLIPRAMAIQLTDENGNDITGGSTMLNLTDEDSIENGIRIYAKVRPDDAIQDVDWHVSDSRNITTHFEQDGALVIRPANSLKSGSITVTAVSKDGSNKTAKTTVRLVRLATDVEIYGLKDGDVVRGGTSVKLSTNVERDRTLADRTIIWEIDNPEAASINSSGKLTTRKVDIAHEVTITATAAANPEAQKSITIQVCPAVESISVSFPDYMGIRGNSARVNYVEWQNAEFVLDSEVLPVEASGSVRWVSSNEAIAEVRDGEVIMHRAGRVRISLESTDGTRIKSYVYLDIQMPVAKVAIDENVSDTLTSGSYTYLKATAWADEAETLPAANQKILWSVTDVYGNRTSAATINSSGRLTAKNVNVNTTVLVTARSAENSSIYDSFELTIKPKRVKEFAVFVDGVRQDGNVNLDPYQTYMVEGYWYYKGENDYELADDCAFFSSNSKVATIGREGTLETSGSGSTTITVRSTDPESGKVYTTKLTAKVFNVAKDVTIAKPKSSILRVGDAVYLSATVWADPVNGVKASNQKVKWSVYEMSGGNMVGTGVASINSSGKLSINSVGTSATIVVIAESEENEGVFDSYAFTIYPKEKYKLYFKLDGVDCSGTEYVDYNVSNLASRLQLWAYNTNNTANPYHEQLTNVTWSTSNKNVIGISNGRPTVVSTGSAKVTAKLNGTSYSASITLRVIHQVTSITVTEKISGQKLYAGRTLVVKAVVDKGATNKSVLWSLDDDSKQYATISAATGLIRAKREISEKVSITVIATAQDGSYIEGTKTITIYPLATSVEIVGPATMSVGDSGVFTANVFPLGEASEAVKWSSSRSTIATIDQDGNVKAKKAGTVTITAEALDGSGKSATFKLTVTK